MDALEIRIGLDREEIAQELSLGAGSTFQKAGIAVDPAVLARQIGEAGRKALKIAAERVREKVREFVPVWRAGLPVQIRSENGGFEEVVYGEGPVFKVHELNGQWSKFPPHAPLKLWVEGKLGLGGKEAESVAWAVAQKIKKSGLTLPNVEGKGQMIQRTQAEMEATGFHFSAFASAFKEELSRIAA